MTRNSLKRIIPHSILLALAVALYAVAGQFDYTQHSGRLAPDVWPKAILVLMMLACIYEIAKNLLLNKEPDEIEGLLEVVHEELVETHLGEVPNEPQAVYIHLLLAGIGLTVVYVLLMEKLGFFLDTLAFMILFMLIGRYRKLWTVIAIGLLGSLAFMFMFMKVVYISLPIGEAPYSAVTLALMQLMGIK